MGAADCITPPPYAGGTAAPVVGGYNYNPPYTTPNEFSISGSTGIGYWPPVAPSPELLLVVKVGSEDRPASDEDIEAVELEIREILGEQPFKLWVTSHTVSLSFVDLTNGRIESDGKAAKG